MLAMHQQNSFEWYTPHKYVDAARLVMGGIDLDPASNAVANKTVRADLYYDRSVDGLTRPWLGRVFLNPPYCKNQSAWVSYLIQQYEMGVTSQALLLIPASTETGWFQWLWSYPVCFTNHRIHFLSEDGKRNSPTIGNAFVYFGSRVDLFTSVFSSFGVVVKRASSVDLAPTLWEVK